MQPGFAGTDIDQVRYNNNQSQSNGQLTGVQQQYRPVSQSQQYVGNTHPIFQPGFAGTDAQQVRQNIAQTTSGQYNTNVGVGVNPSYRTQNQVQNQYVGTQAVFQPGFAGTDVDHVRYYNSQSINNQQNQYLGTNVQQQQQYRGTVGVNQQQSVYPTSPQAVFQPGFAGTDPQQVRQQIAQSQSQNQFGFGQQNTNQYVGPQAVFQTGFAGTNPQQVRQDIANETGVVRTPYGYNQ